MRGATVLFLLMPAGLQAQAQAPAPQRCRLVIENVDRQGTQIQVTPEVVNYFAGGNVRLRCAGLAVRMWSDSVASYQGRVVQFVGHVRYRDSTVEMTADYGTYFRDGEKWEARGNVVLQNLTDGSSLRGPMLDYYRVLHGMRDTTEIYADRRPTVSVSVVDSSGMPDEPYLVVGDRVRFKGEDQVWAGGRVTIDRSDFQGRGDSLFLDTGPGNAGALIGRASMHRTAADSFDLRGLRIDLTFAEKRLTGVTARDSASLRNATLDLEADGIGLTISDEEVTETRAWGETIRPVAVSDAYEARGDSLRFATPDQQLREITAFGNGWLAGKSDSLGGERDWVSGDLVHALFGAAESEGSSGPVIKVLEARGTARAYYRMALAGSTAPSLSYTLADAITIIMGSGTTATVDSVHAVGVRDGVHLQPLLTPADTARTDSIPPRRAPPRPRPEAQ